MTEAMMQTNEPITQQEIDDAREMIGMKPCEPKPARVKKQHDMTPGLYLVIPMDCPEAANVFSGLNLYVLESPVIRQWYFCALVEGRPG